MKVAIIGSQGLVGSFTAKSLQKSSNWNLILADIKEVDILEKESIRKFLKKYEPQIIINFAAYTDVNQAELERNDKEGIVWKLNVEALKNLSEMCVTYGVFLVTIGTDFEFSGSELNPGPYEIDELGHYGDELGWYGLSKAYGLKVLKDTNPNFSYIRISYPFGNMDNQKDFFNKMRSFIDKKYKLICDQHFTPTYLPDLVNALQIICEKKLTGIFHVASPSTTTFFEFGKYMSESKVIEKGKFSNIQSGAKRPQYGGLKVEKTEKILGIHFHSWKEGIEELLA